MNAAVGRQELRAIATAIIQLSDTGLCGTGQIQCIDVPMLGS